MTEAQKELFVKTKNRLRRHGIENPDDVIVALTEEIDFYRGKIERLETQLRLRENVIELLEADIAERDEMLKRNVEAVYAEFMSDYRFMEKELDEYSKELAEQRQASVKLVDACKVALRNAADLWNELSVRTAVEAVDKAAAKVGLELEAEKKDTSIKGE